ncbi:MAG: aldehyde ferredoxin oxidoreductase family protein [Anaerolineae bacterium]|jgi:aldehyde:ferredoxin oxidoreductase|nr:aldehyde ferredoxin oxidoreductase family protein [Anaerolineae bacterium]
MPHSYAGQYLRIDLTTGEIQIQPIAEADVREVLLGSGYAAKLYAEELDPTLDPLDPRAALYIFNGLLTGTYAPTGCRSSWCGRSPLTGIWNEANVGGHIGAELRAAGVDGLVLTGQAPHPVYIYVHDSAEGPVAEIRDAAGIWGLDTFDAYDALLAQTDAKARAAVIGPAGEALMPFAAILQGGREHSRAAARGGMGAVLGSKRVKALVARGTQKPEYADAGAFRATVKELTPIIKGQQIGASRYGTTGGMTGTELRGDLPIHNWAGGSFIEGAHALSGQVLREKYVIKDTFCHACPIGCGKLIEIKVGPHAGVRGEAAEYETVAALGSMLDIDDLEAVNRANEICNRMGIDTISAGSSAAFAFEAFEAGLISLEETDGVPLVWGSVEALFKVLELLLEQRGAGAYLARGVRAAAAYLGNGSEAYAVHVKGLEIAYHDPRAFFSMAANYATANRGGCHLEGLTYWPMYGIAPDAWYTTPYDRFADDGAAAHAIAFQDYMGLYNPLGLCKFAGKVGALYEHLPALIQAATGWDIDTAELRLIGERLFNLKRLINLRLGITAADDTLPKRLLSPRPSGEAAGKVPDLARQLRDYYALRGWDAEGRPSTAKLAELGL